MKQHAIIMGSLLMSAVIVSAQNAPQGKVEIRPDRV